MTKTGMVFFGFIIVLLLSVWLAKKFSARLLSKKNKSPNSIGIAFWALVIFSMISLFFPFTYAVGLAIYELANKPSYLAEVVGYTTEQRTETVSDRIETYDRYRANLRFRNATGEQLELPSSVASGDLPKIGSQITVVYMPGDKIATERSARIIGLYAGASLMLLILGYFLCCIIQYSFAGSMDSLSALGVNFVMYLLIPLVLLLLFFTFTYIAFQYFVLEELQDLPLWSVLMCLFFSLALLPPLFRYLQFFWEKMKRTQ
jgi:hypothetical protein